jgi:hypothetical protein
MRVIPSTGPEIRPGQARYARSVWRRRRAAWSLLDLEVETDQTTIVLDHLCADSGNHRLLGVELTAEELARVLAKHEVTLPVSCDRCLWERRLVVRRRPARAEQGAFPG